MKGDKKTIVAVVFVLVAIAVVAYQLLGTGSAATKAVSNALAATTPSALKPVAVSSAPTADEQKKDVLPMRAYEQLLASVREQDLAFRDVQFKNPMSPLIAENKGATTEKVETAADVTRGYSIKGIIWNDERPLALVNDQVVGVGERLDDGALVTEINPSSVKFTKRGNRYVLVLREE
jgi:hypothetical protein